MSTSNVTPDPEVLSQISKSQQTQQQDKSSVTGWMEQSPGVIGLIGRLVDLKKRQKTQAMNELYNLYQLNKAGFPIKSEAYSKLIKKAGLPLETDPKALENWLGSSVATTKQGQGQGQQQPTAQGKSQPQPTSGPIPEWAKPMVQAQQNLQKGGKALSPEQIGTFFFQAAAQRAMQVQNRANMTEDQKAEFDLNLNTLQNKASQGDNEARGRLMALGKIPFDQNFETWNSFNPKQRQSYLEMQSGGESEAQKKARGERIGEQLISSGKVTDPSSAYKIGDILAAGGDVPKELQSQMKAHTFKEMSDEVTLSQQLTEMGVPPNKLASTIKAAENGGLANALPTGMKPIVLQQLQMQQEQIGLEKARLGFEEARARRGDALAQVAAAAEARKEMTAQQQADVNFFKELVDMQKAKVKIPDEIVKAAQVKAAQALGMKVEETKTLWNHLTGGTSLKFTPNISEEGKSTVDKLSGKSRATDQKQESGFKGFVKGLISKPEPKEPL